MLLTSILAVAIVTNRSTISVVAERLNFKITNEDQDSIRLEDLLDDSTWARTNLTFPDKSDDDLSTAKKVFDYSNGLMARYSPLRHVPSGFPIGIDVYADFDQAYPHGNLMRVHTEEFFAQISVKRQITPRGESGAPKFSKRSKDRLITHEALLRWFIALETHKLSGTKGSNRIGFGGAEFQRLDLWAKTKGKTVNWNFEAARASIQTGKGLLVVPLGSPKVKLGDEWVTIPDVVMADLNGPYLPVSLLKSL